MNEDNPWEKYFEELYKTSWELLQMTGLSNLEYKLAKDTINICVEYYMNKNLHKEMKDEDTC